MDGSNLSPVAETGNSTDTEKFLRLKDFDHAYDVIVRCEDNLHGLTIDSGMAEYVDTLKSIAGGKFILTRREGDWGIDLLKEEALTAVLVYEAKNDPISPQVRTFDIINVINNQFYSFLDANDTTGMIRSIERLGWLTNSVNDDIATRAGSEQGNKGAVLKEYLNKAKKASA